MPLVIYDLGDGHTHTYVLWQNESDFKKPGGAPDLKSKKKHNYSQQE